MYSVLFTVFMFANYHGEPSVSTQMIGQYSSIETCQKIANQLSSGVPARIGGDGYGANIRVYARCVQIKD